VKVALTAKIEEAEVVLLWKVKTVARMAPAPDAEEHEVALAEVAQTSVKAKRPSKMVATLEATEKDADRLRIVAQTTMVVNTPAGRLVAKTMTVVNAAQTTTAVSKPVAGYVALTTMAVRLVARYSVQDVAVLEFLASDSTRMVTDLETMKVEPDPTTVGVVKSKKTASTVVVDPETTRTGADPTTVVSAKAKTVMVNAEEVVMVNAEEVVAVAVDEDAVVNVVENGVMNFLPSSTRTASRDHSNQLSSRLPNEFYA